MDSYFIFLDKPAGITSQQLLTQYKRTLPRKTKVGHHGTLDPFATGLMLVAVGEACKFLPYVDDSRKTYVATLKLGQKTSTGDPEGPVIEEKPVPNLDAQKIEAVLKSLIGPMEQMPPMYSAVKVQGKKLYEYARKGEEVERKTRLIEIFDLKLLVYDIELNTVQFEVVCSRGTYVRTLGETISEKLGTTGYLIELRRTGLLSISKSQTNQPLAIESLLSGYPSVDCTSDEKMKLYQGKILSQKRVVLVSVGNSNFYHKTNAPPSLRGEAEAIPHFLARHHSRENILANKPGMASPFGFAMTICPHALETNFTLLICENIFFGIGRILENQICVERLLRS